MLVLRKRSHKGDTRKLQTSAIPEGPQRERKKGTSICLGAYYVPGIVLDAFNNRLAIQFSQQLSEVTIMITPALQAKILWFGEASGLFKVLLRWNQSPG